MLRVRRPWPGWGGGATAAGGLRAHQGAPRQGTRRLAEALAVVDQTGVRHLEAELYRLQGELLLAQSSNNHAAAETCLSQALAIARRQQARAWELRAAMSLSRLWQ